MKKLYTLFFTVLFVMASAFTLQAQNLFFTDISESAIQTGNSKRVIIPQKFRSVSLNNQGLKNFLLSLPSEKNVVNRRQTPVLELPTPDGKMARFHVWESSIQEPGLEAKFPEIKTFTGQGIDDPYATIRLDYSPYGFHAQVLTINGTYYIDPYARGMVDNYISYYRKDFRKTGTLFCEVPDNTVSTPPINNVVAAQCLGTDLRTYRLAVACTGEYAQAPGISAGANPAILHAAIVTTVNRVVGVYENEVSIRMVLVANNDLVEFLNAATDPFNGNNNANVLINESQTVIDANIGFTNYDIGHTFSTGGGGLAQLNSPCGGSKARGITGSPNPTGDAYDIDYVAHEMGHQFGGNHSMAGCGSSPTATKYEVGSGTTIQAYAGICGAENIQPNSDPFFHAISFDEISNFVTTGGGSSCGTIAATGNTLPVIDPLPNSGLSIPPSTAFTLTGSATDANGDPLTYCWEQWDFSGVATWNAGATAAAGNTVPLFKSRIPKTTGSRTFPDMAVILANYPANPPSAMAGLKGETLSPVARVMKFRLTVRDNRAAGGGVVSSGSGCQGTGIYQVNVVGTTPFTVSAPNGGEAYPSASTQTITWNTAGTENSPVSVANVRILMSTDGGLTYPTTLLASTANDGSEAVTIPCAATTTARIKIEAVGNIFFDISNANFSINAPAVGFGFTAPAAATAVCGVSPSAAVTLGSLSNCGYVTPINLTASGNPAGTTVSFGTNPVVPGNSSIVTLNNTNTLNAGTYTITVTGTSGASVVTQTLTYTVQAGAGPVITTQPAAQQLCAGSNVTFTVASATAISYQWQVSTDGGTNFSNITGATAALYSITGTTAIQNNNQYRCIVLGQCNSTTSAAALLTVNTPPSIATQPVANTTLCVGANTTYTVTANGSALAYQWQLSTTGAGGPWNNISNAGVYSGATTATLSLTGVTAAMTSYQYRCVVTGTCAPAANSNNAILTVNTPVTITTQPPATTNICATGTASFTTVVTGTSPSYQWQESTNGGTTFTNITNGGIYGGATTNTLTLNGITAAMNGNVYRNIVTGNAPCGAVNSQNSVLNVTPQPVIAVTQTALLAGQQTTLSVNVTPAPGLSFAWYLNNVLQAAATGNSIVATVNQLGNYRVVVTSGTGSCQSELKEITAAPSTKLFVFPSPNDGRFTVSYYTAGASLTNPTKQSITIYDSYGRRVHNQEYTVSQPYQLHQMDLRRNGAGVYYIVLREANGNKIKTGEVLVR